MNYNCKELLSKEFILYIIKSDKSLILKYNKFIKRLEILNDSKKNFVLILNVIHMQKKIKIK